MQMHMTEALAAAVGSVLAVGATGPLVTVFNELGLVMAIMGGLGGLAFALAIKAPWRAVIHPAMMGSMLGFGIGILGPLIVEWQTGVEVGPVGGSVETLAAIAFLLGFIQERIIHFARPTKGEDKDGNDSDA